MHRTLRAALLCCAAVAALAGCGSVGEHVAAIIDADTLTVHDFVREYLHTRMQPPDSAAQIGRFLDLLVNFRVKEKEAEKRGMAKDPAFVKDFDSYRDQLAVSFLLDREVMEPAVRTLYGRRKDEVLFEHILVAYKHTPEGDLDTAATRRAALALLDTVRASRVPFDTLIDRYSEDAQKERTRGRIGWIIAGTTFPELDDIVYALKPGEISPTLLKSSFGYHIIKLIGRRKARVRVHAAHILYRLDIKNPTDTAAGYARLSLILDTLRRGQATFAELARRNSMDPVSGAKGGDLGWLERGTNLEPQFEEALFNVPTGEVSPIVHSTFGLHIIKVLEESGPRPLDEQRNDLREIVHRGRYEEDYRAYVAKLRERYGFTISPDVVRVLSTRFDSTVNTSTPGWDRRLSDRDKEAYLFRLNDRKYTVREAVGDIRRVPDLQMRRFTQANLDTIATELADRVVLIRETEGLESREPEFASLLEEYRQSALVSKLEEHDVIDKTDVTDADLRAYWEKRKDEYRWPDRVRFSEILVYTREHAQQLLDSLQAGVDFNVLASRQTRRPGMMEKSGRWDFEPVDFNELARAAAALAPGQVSGPVGTDIGISIVRCDAKDPARLKTFEEVKPEIVGLVKEELVERRTADWVEGLRETYRVRTFPDHLTHAFDAASK